MVARSRNGEVPVVGAVTKRATGIIGLDLLLEGGFPTGSVIMVYGTPLAGVDLAALQFWKVEGEEGTYLMNDGNVESGMVDAAEFYPEMYLPQMIGHRIVVDSFSLLVIRYGIDNSLKFLRLAREEMHRRSANLVFIVYSNVHTPVEMMRIMRAADVVLELRTETSQCEIERTLVVHKVRDGPVPQRLLPFVVTERGIEASTTSRVV